MGTIAIGDIHGNRAGLEDVLGQVREKADARDAVVFLGDYIDRGPDSKGCIDAILSFRGERAADVVCLYGNHEDWLLQTLRDPTAHAWLLGMDGYTTIRSYSVEAEETLRQAVRATRGAVYEGTVPLPYDVFFDAMPTAHRQFLASLVSHHSDDQGVYVHAGVDWRVPLSEQDRHTLTLGWDDSGFPEAYRGTHTVLYGHRNNAVLDEDGWPHPRTIGKTIGLDTSRHGVVSAMRLPDLRVFQSARFRHGA